MSKNKLQTGAHCEAEIERILPGGWGLAHADGATLMIALAAARDRVRVRVNRVQGRVAFAEIEALLEPSPDRVTPPCRYYGVCGGCDFQHLNYAAQLAAKAGIIRDCLRRIAKIELPEEAVRVVLSPQEWRYRTRAQWQADLENKKLGYFMRGTHQVIDVAECPILVPALQQTLTALRADLSPAKWLFETNEAEAVAGSDDAADNGFNANNALPPLPHNVSLSLTFLDENSAVINVNTNGFRYAFDAQCFFQVNHGLLEPLVDYALKYAAQANEPTTALDLYCGVGLFTLPLARKFARVVGVEGNAHAVEFARRNLTNASLTNAEFHVSSVGAWLRGQAAEVAPVDFVLLDPPRAGLEDGALENLLKLRARRIAYVACDPATLARDLKLLVEAGYGLRELQGFDLFPQTHHVETVAHLHFHVKNTKPCESELNLANNDTKPCEREEQS